MAFRPFLLAALIPMTLAACGGDDDSQPTPEGTHYHYVANKLFVPTSSNESRDYGLDLNGDGSVDNTLGSVLSALKAQGGFDVQTTIDTSVNEGSIILLADFQTKDFTSSSASGIQVFLGTNPMPAPCAGSDDTTCGHHLDGTGSFDVDPNGPTNAALAGKIVGGTFTGGPGDLSLQIAIGGTDPIQLNLIGARAKATGISETDIMSVIFAGAITQDDINMHVIPAIAPQLEATVEKDCTDLTNPPDCGCTGTGTSIISLFDKMPVDCHITADELVQNDFVKGLLAPDVTIDGKMALSVGVKATAKKATYTVAGQ